MKQVKLTFLEGESPPLKDNTTYKQHSSIVQSSKSKFSFSFVEKNEIKKEIDLPQVNKTV